MKGSEGRRSPLTGLRDLILPDRLKQQQESEQNRLHAIEMIRQSMRRVEQPVRPRTSLGDRGGLTKPIIGSRVKVRRRRNKAARQMRAKQRRLHA